MDWLALDIGGANLKLANGRGFAAAHGFAMWKQAAELAGELRKVIAEAPRSDHLAVTMTGELADCFATKEDGVRYILRALVEAADGRHTRVYLTNGKLVTPQVAISKPLLAAASNWHALARFTARYAPQGAALVMDVGSTTCDLVPLQDGEFLSSALTDTDRLLRSELVYTGVERSPVCALVSQVPYRGQSCSIAQEVFATTGDVYVILGDLPESPLNTNTADGKPATKPAARQRLGRLICASGEQFNHRDAVFIAQAVAQAQQQQLATATRRVLASHSAPPDTVVLCGQGEFLARRVLGQLGISARIVSLSQQLGPSASRCAPAHALAVLASEAAAP